MTTLPVAVWFALEWIADSGRPTAFWTAKTDEQIIAVAQLNIGRPSPLSDVAAEAAGARD